MSENQEAKKAVVGEITDKIKNSKSLVLVSYTQLTVKDASDLRNKCRDNGCEYKVYKNTLVRRALNDMGFDQFDADLNGPTAFAFGADETGAAKIMAEAEKTYADKIGIKSAFVDDTYVDKDGVHRLATMPSKDELLAKMLGSMEAPIANLAGICNNLLAGIARVLDGIAKSKAEA